MLSWKRPNLGQTESGGYLWPQAPIPGIIPSEWGLAPAPDSTEPPASPEPVPFPVPGPMPQPAPVYVVNPPAAPIGTWQPYAYLQPLPVRDIPGALWGDYHYSDRPLPEMPLRLEEEPIAEEDSFDALPLLAGLAIVGTLLAVS